MYRYGMGKARKRRPLLHAHQEGRRPSSEGVRRWGGVLGHIAALQDAQERRRREQEAGLWNEERDRLEALVAPVDQLCEATEILYRAALLSAGFRRHQRGEWRRKREPKE